MKGFLASKFKGEGLKSLLVRLHGDEQGAVSLEHLLIIAAFILPLLGLLLWYKDDMAQWVNKFWEKRKEDSESGDFAPDLDPTH